MPSAPPAVLVTDEDLEEPPPTRVLPTLAIPAPAVPPPRVPALPQPSTTGVPAALRSEGLDEPEPGAGGGRGRDGLGGVMVAAIGIAVAALRGMTQWMEDRRQRFQDQAPVRLAAATAKAGRIKDRAEHESALAAIGHDAAKARAKGRVQSPTEYGRDATKNKGGGKGKGGGSKGTFGETGGGAGGGRGPKSGSGGPGGKNRPSKELTAHGSTGVGGKSGAGAKDKGGRGGGSKGPDGSGGSGGKGKDGGGKSPRSPKSGKSPSTSSSSPALERTRGRQERAADKQRAKDQRRADRAAAQLEDWGKGRDRKQGSENDRQAVKDRIRNGRLEAKAARKDAARDARREERAAAKKDRKERRKEKREAEDRTTLGQAIGQSLTEEAERRLKARREALDPPVLSRRKKDATAEETTESEAEAGPKVDLKKKPRAPKGSSTAPPKATSPKPPPPGAEEAVPGSEAPGEEGGGPTGSGPGSRSRRTREQQPPPRQEPRPDGEWLRPPPGMRVGYKVWLSRPDLEAKAKARAEEERAEMLRRRARIANVFNPRAGLPPGPTAGSKTPPASAPPPPPTSSSTGSPAPKNERKAPIPMPGGPPAHPAPPPSSVGDTQFTDSDLTVYDVIDADRDMAEEIMAGAEHALLVAEKCQRLQSALEGLRASLIAKSVPGVFVGWCTRLIDRAGVVEDKAVAVARGLPRAAEAIATAGAVAAEHDKPVADVVRDMGHTAPAESSYHQE
ncbi:hypothetical protein ACFV1C_07095 [Streptomyces sp. NPDC059605]|uniref:hypothetical protein n=1 Tax=unclassified Streptomyces TaxID=2593676 RepID=UPI003679798E